MKNHLDTTAEPCQTPGMTSTTRTQHILQSHANGEHADRYEPGCPVCDRQFERDVPAMDDQEPVR